MRIAFLVLLLANLVLFVWGQGHLGTQGAGREPERMAQQLAPEKLRIVQAQ
ncbi:MAG: hypothetical protein KGZ43_09465 [Sulfuritalea sp.]|nr:hypothetical protein [Sulfuritalea sp.]